MKKCSLKGKVIIEMKKNEGQKTSSEKEVEGVDRGRRKKNIFFSFFLQNDRKEGKRVEVRE